MFASSLFRIFLFFLIWIAVWLPLAIPLSKKINYQFSEVPTVEQKLILLASLYPFSILIITLIIHQEGLSWVDFGWQWQLKELFFLGSGIVIAIISLILVFSLEWACGFINWHWENSHKLLLSFFPVFGLALAISFVEESIFRGFLINELNFEFPYWLSAIASSIIFALSHTIWDRQQAIPQLPGLWLMGIVLVLSRIVAAGNLGIAWGLHTGWILGLTCLDSAELISYNTDEKNWLTGIDRQPLAGFFGILCLLIVGCGLFASLVGRS